MKRVATNPVPLRRRGFTLIEMLVAIGIILLLLTIGIVGYRSMERGQMEKATRAALANADAMVSEMKSVGSVALLEGPADASPAPAYTTGSSIGSPGNVNVGQAGRGNLITNHSTKVMNVLLQNPKNKTAVANLPVANLVPPAGTTVYNDPPILSDGWGNPLMFVPSGGLTGINFPSSGTNGQKVTSTGAGNPSTPRSPQDRAFWASAGPDGDFTTGEDNLYSFQK